MTLPNSFIEANSTLRLKPNKDNIRKENYRQINIPCEDTYKYPQKNTSKQKSYTILEELNTTIYMWCIQYKWTQEPLQKNYSKYFFSRWKTLSFGIFKLKIEVISNSKKGLQGIFLAFFQVNTSVYVSKDKDIVFHTTVE